MKAYCRECESVTDHHYDGKLECTICGEENGDGEGGYCRICEEKKRWPRIVKYTCISCRKKHKEKQ